MGSAIFVQINRTLVECRQRVEHFLDGRVAGSATGKKNGKVMFLLSFIFCFKVRPVGNEMRILLTTQCHLLILCK